MRISKWKLKNIKTPYGVCVVHIVHGEGFNNLFV